MFLPRPPRYFCLGVWHCCRHTRLSLLRSPLMRVFAALHFFVRAQPEVLKAVPGRVRIAVAAAPMATNCPMIPCPFCFLAVGHDATGDDIAQALQRCVQQRACSRLTQFQFGMFRNAAAEALYSRGFASSPLAPSRAGCRCPIAGPPLGMRVKRPWPLWENGPSGGGNVF